MLVYIHLHSTVVLLKLLTLFLLFLYIFHLHSTVVLLKRPSGKIYQYQFPLFTFYCSSIKTDNIITQLKYCYGFTFYCSSIKTRGIIPPWPIKVGFTFYCSSIKTNNGLRGMLDSF